MTWWYCWGSRPLEFVRLGRHLIAEEPAAPNPARPAAWPGPGTCEPLGERRRKALERFGQAHAAGWTGRCRQRLMIEHVGEPPDEDGQLR